MKRFALLLFVGLALVGCHSRQSAESANAALIDCAARGATTCSMSALFDGASVNTANAKGESPLLLASGLGSSKGNKPEPTVLFWLIRAGASPNVKDSSGQTPLLASLAKADDPNMVEIARRLIEAGASPNDADSSGTTPLMLAVQRSSELVKALIDAGAKVDAENAKGETAKSLALKATDTGDKADILHLLSQGETIQQDSAEAPR